MSRNLRPWSSPSLAPDPSVAPSPIRRQRWIFSAHFLSLVLDGSPQKRKKIAPGQRVPVKLSPRDRELIIEYAMLDQSLIEHLEKAAPDAGVVAFEYTLDHLDALLGTIAAEANHCKSKKLQRELDGITDRVKTVMESYDDEG